MVGRGNILSIQRKFIDKTRDARVASLKPEDSPPRQKPRLQKLFSHLKDFSQGSSRLLFLFLFVTFFLKTIMDQYLDAIFQDRWELPASHRIRQYRGSTVYVAPAAGKGHGLFAARDIRCGEIILSSDREEHIIEDRRLRNHRFRDTPLLYMINAARAFPINDRTIEKKRSVDDIDHIVQTYLSRNTDGSNCKFFSTRDGVTKVITTKAVSGNEELLRPYAATQWIRELLQGDAVSRDTKRDLLAWFLAAKEDGAIRNRLGAEERTGLDGLSFL